MVELLARRTEVETGARQTGMTAEVVMTMEKPEGRRGQVKPKGWRVEAQPETWA